VHASEVLSSSLLDYKSYTETFFFPIAELDALLVRKGNFSADGRAVKQYCCRVKYPELNPCPSWSQWDICRCIKISLLGIIYQQQHLTTFMPTYIYQQHIYTNNIYIPTYIYQQHIYTNNNI